MIALSVLSYLLGRSHAYTGAPLLLVIALYTGALYLLFLAQQAAIMPLPAPLRDELALDLSGRCDASAPSCRYVLAPLTYIISFTADLVALSAQQTVQWLAPCNCTPCAVCPPPIVCPIVDASVTL